MDAAAFVRWRARHGFKSWKLCATALGLSEPQVKRYAYATAPIPHVVALACRGYDADHHVRRSLGEGGTIKEK